MDEGFGASQEEIQTKGAKKPHGIGYGHPVEQQGKEEKQQSQFRIVFEKNATSDESCHEDDHDCQGVRARVFEAWLVRGMTIGDFAKIIFEKREELQKHQTAADRNKHLGDPEGYLEGLRDFLQDQGTLNHLGPVPHENPAVDETQQGGEELQKIDRLPGKHCRDEVNPRMPLFLKGVRK